VFVAKYRFEILVGKVAIETGRCIRAFVEQQHGELIELKVVLPLKYPLCQALR
jgi:hypothetical protein